MPQVDEKVLEAVARAICKFTYLESFDNSVDLNNEVDFSWKEWHNEARGAIEAYLAATGDAVAQAERRGVVTGMRRAAAKINSGLRQFPADAIARQFVDMSDDMRSLLNLTEALWRDAEKELDTLRAELAGAKARIAELETKWSCVDEAIQQQLPKLAIYERVHAEIADGKSWSQIPDGMVEKISYEHWLAYMEATLKNGLRDILLSYKHPAEAKENEP